MFCGWLQSQDVAEARTGQSSIPIDAAQLDRQPGGAPDTVGGYFHCMINGTYDPDARDKNLDTSLPLDATITFPDGDPNRERFGDQPVGQPELVQWSWAKRARCQKTIGTVSAASTGVLAIGYLIALEAHNASARRVSAGQLTDIGLITLLPAMVDELRAVGPTRRYYTSAIIGTSLMSVRNKRLENDLAWLATKAPGIADASALTCTPMKPVTFKVKPGDLPGIDALQAKVVLDIAASRDWCQSFGAIQTKVWVAQSRHKMIEASFATDRGLAWRLYANTINNGGYEQQATTATVLHKIITLPLVALTDVVGTDEGAYKLGGDRPAISAEDAATLPTLSGDYSLTLPSSDLETLTLSAHADMKAVQTALEAYTAKPGSATDDQAADQVTAAGELNAYEAAMPSAAAIDKYYYGVTGVMADINNQNARCYLILDVTGGAAYLSDRSVGMLKTDGTTTPNPTPACQVGGATPASAAPPAPPAAQAAPVPAAKPAAAPKG